MRTQDISHACCCRVPRQALTLTDSRLQNGTICLCRACCGQVSGRNLVQCVVLAEGNAGLTVCSSAALRLGLLGVIRISL